MKPTLEQLEAQVQEMQKALDEAQRMLEDMQKPAKWEPKGGYYYVNDRGAVIFGPTADSHRLAGVEYTTEEAATRAAAAMRIHNRLLAYREEFAPGYAPDWHNLCEDKGYVYYAHSNGWWVTATNMCTETVGAVYMPKDVAEELCRKLNSGEVVL